MKRSLIALITVLSFACNNKQGWKETDSGLQYTIFEDRGSQKPKFGDALQMHLIYKDGSDSVLYNSKVLGNAFIVEFNEPPFMGSLEEGFAMMGEGDSAAFLVSSDSVFKNVFRQPMPGHITAGSRLRIDVRLNNILTPNEYKSFIIAAEQNKKLANEGEEINKYMADNQVSAMPEPSGLYFISFADGVGKQAKMGDSVEVSYLVRSLNGEVFDASEKGYRFRVGDSAMVRGWTEGISKMKEGGKARFIVPAKLGYGATETGKIPPNTTLVFDVDLIKVY